MLPKEKKKKKQTYTFILVPEGGASFHRFRDFKKLLSGKLHASTATASPSPGACS